MLNVFTFLAKQRLLAVFAVVVIALVGSLAWLRLPIDAFPDVTNVQAMLLVEAPGLSPSDVERQISFPLELAMQGLPLVREVRSLSKASLAQVVVVFEDETDIYFARQLVNERLSTVRAELPDGVEPELTPVSTGLGEIYQYTLESDTLDATELRSLQDWVVAPQLRNIAGVTEVNSFGGYVRQAHVVVDPDALLKYQLSLDDIVHAIAQNNANVGGSYILKGWEQAYVRSVGLLHSLDDLRAIVLHAHDGTPVLLNDVAQVEFGTQTRQGAVTRDARGEVVAGMAIMLRGQNSKQVVDRIRQNIPRIQASLGAAARINTYYDRSSLIQACVDTVSHALLQGGALVLLVLFVFLGSWRAGLCVALSLPLTALLTFVFMGAADLTANLMSLGGLAIAIGMVVDGAVVVVENAVRHTREAALSPTSHVAAVARASQEVARPVLFAILIIIVVFFPLLTLEGLEGKMFRPLALTMVFAMFSSLIVALLVMPGLSAVLLRADMPQSRRLDVALQRLYGVVLDSMLRHRRLVLGMTASLFVAAAALLPLLGTEFLPALDEGAIAINVVRLPSASLEGSVRVANEIERRLLKFDEVETVVTKTGRAEISEDPMGPEQSDVIIMLKPQSQWRSRRNKAELVDAMQTSLAKIPGIRLSFSQPIALRVNELISGIKSDVAIKVFGEDLGLLQQRAESIGDKLSGIPGAVDVRIEQITGFQQLDIVLHRDAMARFGLNVADVNSSIETAVGGRIATDLFEGERRIAVQVRYPQNKRDSLEVIANMLVSNPHGAQVPLSRIATLGEIEAPAQISREDGMRRVVIECNVRGRDLGSFVEQLHNELAGEMATLPTGYRIDIGGQFENQQRAMQRLAWIVPVSIGLIFVLLFVALGAVRHALVVLLNLPLALVGGVFVLLVAQIPLSVSAAIGFIALLGIAVENGVVLVAFIVQQRRERDLDDAIRHACQMRVRPLLMTTLTTLLGLVPLLFASGAGSDIQRPLALVVVAGLISSTLLTLFVLPLVFRIVETRFAEQSPTEPTCVTTFRRFY